MENILIFVKNCNKKIIKSFWVDEGLKYPANLTSV